MNYSHLLDLDALKAAGINSAEHSALLLERHRCAARMELLLELVRKECADLEQLDRDIAANEYLAARGARAAIPFEEA